MTSILNRQCLPGLYDGVVDGLSFSTYSVSHFFNVILNILVFTSFFVYLYKTYKKDEFSRSIGKASLILIGSLLLINCSSMVIESTAVKSFTTTSFNLPVFNEETIATKSILDNTLREIIAGEWFEKLTNVSISVIMQFLSYFTFITSLLTIGLSLIMGKVATVFFFIPARKKVATGMAKVLPSSIIFGLLNAINLLITGFIIRQVHLATLIILNNTSGNSKMMIIISQDLAVCSLLFICILVLAKNGQWSKEILDSKYFLLIKNKAKI